MSWFTTQIDAERDRLARYGLVLLRRYYDRTRPHIRGRLVSASAKYAVVLCGGVRKRVMYRDVTDVNKREA